MEKIKLTRDELTKIVEVLNSLDGLYSVKMKYAIKKNKDLLKSEVDAVNEALNTNSKRFKEFEEKRMKKVEECVERLENGRFKFLPDGKNVIIRDDKQEYFKNAMLELQKEYKDGLEERDNELKDFNNFINEEVEIEVFKISNDIIPNDISQKAYETLFPLII